ncbi:MAG TPA: sarcosine oxidase subunit gamma family protein [Marmoricola sp.]|nr:sarcosine oxidase subunit gamma family protein [Marmoricola sp.]
MAETMTHPEELPADLRRSPLAGLSETLAAADAAGDRGVTVREVPFLTMVSVRAEPRSGAAVAIGEVLGAPLPDRVGSSATSGEHTALWLGPDEWLVVSTSPAAPLVARLSVALGYARGDIVDVSANRTTLELTGPSARAVLAKGCPADLHPQAFGVGSTITTTLGPVPLLLWRSGEESWRLLPRSSFADYVARWLVDAAAEFGLPAVP